MLAIVCPGQGSQTPGFLEPWLELPGISENLNKWSEETGVDLVTHGTVSDEDTIKDTAVAQPLIVAAGLLAAQALKISELDAGSWMTAGHSVVDYRNRLVTGALLLMRSGSYGFVLRVWPPPRQLNRPVWQLSWEATKMK